MNRILLKLSGEALAGAKKTGFDEETVIAVSRQIRTIAEEGTQVGIVIGGGNFWRGRTSETINRNKADQIGMLATVMNCIYVSEVSTQISGQSRNFYLRFVCGAFTKLYSGCSGGVKAGKIYSFCRWNWTSYFPHRHGNCTCVQ